MKDTSWAHALEVTADGNGLVGQAGAILLRMLADRAGLTFELDSALALKGTFPVISRGVVLVSAAISIAMGATAMADIDVLEQLKPALGDARSRTPGWAAFRAASIPSSSTPPRGTTPPSLTH